MRRPLGQVCAISLLLAVVSVPASAESEWIAVASTPRGGTHGKWHRVSHDAYAKKYSASASPYIRLGGDWTTARFDDSTWGGGHCTWDSDWDLYGWRPLPEIGKNVWRSTASRPNGITELHRYQFSLPNERQRNIVAARIRVFSDNHSSWYINGQHVLTNGANSGGIFSIPPDPFQLGAENLLAVEVSNDNVCHGCNPLGLQYIVEVKLGVKSLPH